MKSTKGACTFEGCERVIVCKSLCNGHYTQQYKGLPLTPLHVRHAPTPCVAIRDRSVCWTDWSELPCWEGLDGWGGSMSNGYPMLGRGIKVMWLVLEADGRPRPPAPNNHGLHSCDTPACWNPAHLRWGGHEGNLGDRVRKLGYCQHCAHCNP